MGPTPTAQNTFVVQQETTAQQRPNTPVFLLVAAGVLLPAFITYALATANEAHVVALALGIIGVLGILLRPFWGLILFVAMLYGRPEEAIPALAGLRLTLMVSLVTLAAMVLQMCLERERVVRTPVAPMLLGFLGIVILSTLNTGNTQAAAQDVGKLVILALLVLNLIRTPERYRSLVTALIVFTGYLALFSIYLYFTGGALVHQSEDVARAQATGIFNDPNDLAATIVAGLALTLSRALSARGATRAAYFAFCGLCAAAVFLTHSRGGLLALLFLIGASILLAQRRKAPAIAAAVVAAILVLAVAPSRMTSFDRHEESANSRFWFWSNGVDMLTAHPLTGVGYRQFAEFNNGKVAHNSFVQCFAEVGLPGYFLWMGCLYYCFRRRPGCRPDAAAVPTADADGDLEGARLALAAFLAACFFISRTYVPVLYLLICLPLSQQVSIRRDPDALHVPANALPFDLVRIGSICLLSIVFIKGLAEYLR